MKQNDPSQELDNELNENREHAETDNENTAAQADTDASSTEEGNVEVLDASHLKSEVQRLQTLADDYQQRSLRTQADFDNFRKRTQKEKEDFAKYASSKLITELLPIIDNFERAISAAGDIADNDSFAKGVGMIFRQLEGVLKAEGLEPMEAVGQPFNPEFHQAIMQVESDEHEEGIVVEEVQKGYMLKDRVLRPAMVKVSM
ncbi:nucleotide exchange factor GrpE [Paenibacillus chibensis]|uniref:nucleotide exchange factor GrpE n=1 Tax=Paenibacillus chibensis TaxID=59846 RepID=UPI000FD778E4|nr:nucleotide exchange factor GrpE [Paenibacillus chibensis]MEC0369872.1 nucleotide exchange factor GrpE [Paenibacillus chibensis]